MELKDTIKLMESSEYKDRFKAEYFQLKIRIDKLTEMVDKYEKGTLTFTPSCSLTLLNNQLESMIVYALYLTRRAEIEEIDLDEEL